jgi:cysteine synthase A
MTSTTIMDQVGNTPLLKLPLMSALDLYAKLEFLNPTGSVKDRAARHIIDTLIGRGEIGPATTVLESSSGNFGIALAAACRQHGMRFVCVVDPHLSRISRCLIEALGGVLEVVDELDQNAGYLHARIRRVEELGRALEDSYWVNQYANPLNADAYYQTLGGELCRELDAIDYVFIAVSSCGTIAGASRRVKEAFPLAKVVAVDIEGSVIFGGEAKRRYVPGVGSSRVPPILAQARIDEVVRVAETEMVDACHRLARGHQLVVGGSSGAVIAAIEAYFSAERRRDDRRRLGRDPVAVTLFPDRGERYVDTIFNPEWCEWLREVHARADSLAVESGVTGRERLVAGHLMVEGGRAIPG